MFVQLLDEEGHGGIGGHHEDEELELVILDLGTLWQETLEVGAPSPVVAATTPSLRRHLSHCFISASFA